MAYQWANGNPNKFYKFVVYRGKFYKDDNYGYIAIGKNVKGAVEILENTLTPNEIKNVILNHFPNTWNFIVEILSHITFKS